MCTDGITTYCAGSFVWYLKVTVQNDRANVSCWRGNTQHDPLHETATFCSHPAVTLDIDELPGGVDLVDSNWNPHQDSKQQILMIAYNDVSM